MRMKKIPRPLLNYFNTTSHPYYILTQQYLYGSYGLRSFYHLCHILNQLGFEAYITDGNPKVDLRLPLLTQQVRERHLRQGLHPIAVYGEEIEGNILCGDVVIRWIMNLIGHVRRKRDFRSDLVYYFSPFYAAENSRDNILNMLFYDEKIFNTENSDNKNRNGFCWYAHKYLQYGNKKVSQFIKNNGISICRDINFSQEQLADTFKRSKVLFCYEESSVISEAKLCGCSVVCVKTDYFDGTQYEYLGEDTTFATEEEIEKGKYEVVGCENFKKWYDANKEKSWECISNFIITSQSMADKCSDISYSEPFCEFCLKNDRIYIYGAGFWGRQCFDVMKSIGKMVQGFIVSDDRFEPGKNYENIPIFRLADIINNENEFGIIIAALKKNRQEIVKILDRKKIGNFFEYPVLV